MLAERAADNAPARVMDVSPKRKLSILICIAVAIIVNSLNAIEPFYTVEALARNPAGGPEYHAAVGAVYSVHQFGGMAAMPFIVADLPNVGGSNMLVIALGAEGCSHLIFALLGKIDDWKVFLAYSYCIRAIQGVAFMATHIASMSCLVQLYPTSVGFASSFQLSALAFGHAASELMVGGLYDVGGFKTPFLVTGFMMLAVSVSMAIFMVDVDKTAAAGVTDDTAREKHVSAFAVLRAPWIVLTLSMAVMVNITYSSAAALLAVRMKSEFGSSATVFSVAFGIQIAINAILAPIAGALLDRGWRARPMIVAGATLMGLGCLLIGPADFLHLPNSLWLVFVTQVPWGAGRIMTVVAGIYYIYHHCEHIGLGTAIELRVAVAGVTRTILTLGYAMGPIIASPLTAVLGFQKTFTLLGFATFGMAAMFTVAVILGKTKEAVQIQCQRVSGNDADGKDMELQPLKP